jgi:hypothetical protein
MGNENNQQQVQQALELVRNVLRQVRATADEHQQIAQAWQIVVQAAVPAVEAPQPPPVSK